jgi:hypothetical protein
MPGPGMRVTGFVIPEAAAAGGVAGQVAVYLPQTYNFAGETLIAPRDRSEDLALASSDVMAFISTGGVTEGGRDVRSALDRQIPKIDHPSRIGNAGQRDFPHRHSLSAVSKRDQCQGTLKAKCPLSTR